jgi:hypothetical protein
VTTSARIRCSESTRTGLLLVALGAWAATVPVALGLATLPPLTLNFVLAVLPGAAVMLAAAWHWRDSKRSGVLGPLLTLAAALWFVVSPIDHLFGPDAALGLPEWVTFFLAPGALIMLVGVCALDVVDVPDGDERRAVQRRQRHVPGHRMRDTHRAVGGRTPTGAHRRQPHGRPMRRVRGDA